jgi:NAD(P)-dependent dehydrogenase (short-subunit alcohol dehydrogenase family)
MKTIQQLMKLDNRTAIITGGEGHIGEAIASALCEAGANIIILDLPNASKIKHSHFSYFDVDLSNKRQLVDVMKKVRREIGKADILVNCAALVGASDLGGWTSPIQKQSLESWQKCFDINLTAAFHIIQLCIPMLQNSDSASIINIGSMYGFAGQKTSLYEGMDYVTPAAYATSKGGLIQLTKYLSTVLCPDIRVNSISPGGMIRGQVAEFVKRYESITPLARMGTEEDIKGASLFLASDLSQYITGQNIVVDGGWSV